MKTKNLLICFIALAGVLFSLNAVNAGEIADVYSIEINGVDLTESDASVIAGETIQIEIWFDALQDASDVKIKAELEGKKVDVEDTSKSFDIEKGFSYKKALKIVVPYELKDEISDDVVLNIKIWNKDHKTAGDITLRVQRPTYNIGVMSISTSQMIDAGSVLPVDVVVKNIGYNNLDDLYVTVKISELNVRSTSYLGDVVAFECFESNDEPCDEDDEDTAMGRFYLKIPYNAKAGIYTIEVEAKNSDVTVTDKQQIVVNNDFSSGNIVLMNQNRNAAIGEDAVYELLVVNPTNNVKVYRFVAESSGALTSGVDQPVIAVPAGSSKIVKVTAKATSEGEYNFNVNVFAGEELVNTIPLSANISGSSYTATPIVVLTIVLAVVFVVLLIVLIILWGKKPEKTEEFGESYY